MADFDEKYKIKIEKYADYYRGTYVINGEKYNLYFSSKDETLKHIESDIRFLTGERRNSSTSLGRPKGTRSYKGRPYNEKDIKRLFNNVSAAVVGSAIAARSAMLDSIADDLLKQVISKAEYDEYTGNLTGSYAATIVQKRRIVDVRTFAKYVTFGAQYPGKSPGSRYSLRRHSKHHAPARRSNPKKRKMRDKHKKVITAKDVRYLKKWESAKYGYSPMYAYRGMSIYPGKINHGDGRSQTGVIVTNSAPYASAVHRTRGRRVIDNSTAKQYASAGWGAKYAQLARFASKSILERAFRGTRGGKNLKIKNI